MEKAVKVKTEECEGVSLGLLGESHCSGTKPWISEWSTVHAATKHAKECCYHVTFFIIFVFDSCGAFIVS